MDATLNAPNKPTKIRLDNLLVERQLADSRTQAQAIIMAGEVRVGTTVLTKPGQLVANEIEIVLAQKSRYVSRGGDKLASVANALKLDFTDAVVLDVGSSTGGFTDYALQNGAKQVICVDVGSDQLAYKLRQDSRITIMERTDIREVSQNDFKHHPNVAVIDVSFISLTKILPSVAKLLIPGSIIIAMAKPQFETDKATASKYKGVIKDDRLRKSILNHFEATIKPEFQILDSADSEVFGAKGNRERFYLLKAQL